MKKLILILFVLLFYTNAIAVPLISTVSPMVEGQSATATGSGFENNASPEPLIMETFETGINGNVIELQNCSDYGTWQANVFDDFHPIYVNTGQRSGSTKSSYHYMIANSGADPDSHGDAWIKFADEHEPVVTISFWYRMDIDLGTSTAVQVKTWRMLNITPWSSDSNSSWFENYWSNRPTDFEMIVSLHRDTLTNTTFPGDDTTLSNAKPNGWIQVILQIKQGTVDTSDGSIRYYSGDYQYSTDICNTYTANTDWERLMIGYFIGNDDTFSSSVELQFDDIYVSDTWQTVWVCDASTFNASTIREPQITTIRADGSLTFTARKGGLLTDSGFLVIVDSDGLEDSEAITFAASTAPVVTLPADFESTNPGSFQGTTTTTAGVITDIVSTGGTVTIDSGAGTNNVTFTVTNVPSPSTVTVTATNTGAEEGFDSVTITLPSPATYTAQAKKATLKKATLK